MSLASKCVLHVLNTVYTILGLGLAAASLWLFVEVKEFTNLRNSNHYLLDYNVYWPQAIPWLFFIVGLAAVCVSACGFSGVRKASKGMMTIYTVCLGVVILLLIAAAIIALIFADNKSTDDFIKDTVWDAYFQSKTDTGVATSFGNIEKRLHCCGAEGPRDYKNWKNEFPTSCCDTYYHGWIGSYSIDCDFTNKLANERHGCSTVASQYARIAIKVLSAISVFIAFIGIFALIAAVALSKNLRKKPRAPPSEADSKKVLL
ncbi:23 kDa integral membrane protein-like [Pectinophora gossypiella]|nr:23 kDa integral membrane protein-like [Pectinophora gossypiella]